MTPKPSNSSIERSGRSRYPGTRPFGDSADDYARFFGRAEEGEELYLRVLSVPLLVQFGKSGLGKTSLLQASLFPRLRQKPFLPVMVRLNVANETLTLAIARSIEQACKAEGLEFPEFRTEGLWECCALLEAIAARAGVANKLAADRRRIDANLPRNVGSRMRCRSCFGSLFPREEKCPKAISI